MLAMEYRGPYRVRVNKDKPIPEILHPSDAIIKVTRSCICGSDLHLYHGLVPDTRVGSTFGHEFTGIVEEIGDDVQNLKVGDRVLVPFTFRVELVCSVKTNFTETAVTPIRSQQQWDLFMDIRTPPVVMTEVSRNT